MDNNYTLLKKIKEGSIPTTRPMADYSERYSNNQPIDYSDETYLYEAEIIKEEDEIRKREEFEDNYLKDLEEQYYLYEAEIIKEEDEIRKREEFEDNYLKDLEEQYYLYEAETIKEEDEIRSREAIKKNTYLSALHKRYENKKNTRNIYMYEIYTSLCDINEFLTHGDFNNYKYELKSLIEELDIEISSIEEKREENGSKYLGHKYLDKLFFLMSDLIDLQDRSDDIHHHINYINSLYGDTLDLDELAEELDITDCAEIINKYFLNKDKVYLENYNRRRREAYKPKLDRINKHKRYIELHKRGYRKVDIAKEMNVSKSAVTHFYERNKEEINKINDTYIKLYQQGHDTVEIAQEMNVTPSDVFNFLKVNYKQEVDFL